MLTIRAQQENRLKEGPRSAFLARIEQHVLNEHPKHLAKLEPSALRQFVERHWEAARGFGLQSEKALRLYLEAVCHFGEEFARDLDWARSLLRGASFEHQKTGELQHRIDEAKGLVTSADGGNGARVPSTA